jgi:hypothetical protein
MLRFILLFFNSVNICNSFIFTRHPGRDKTKTTTIASIINLLRCLSLVLPLSILQGKKEIMSLPQPLTWKTKLHHDDDDALYEVPSVHDGQEQQQHTDSCNNNSLLVDNDRDEQARGSSSRYDNNEHDNENGNDDARSGEGLDQEIVYSVESFGAIVAPVSITMILSALVVVFFNTDETLAAGEQIYAKTYEFVDLQEGNSTQNLGASLVNTLVFVSIICMMTFVLVLLYKYRCLKIFYGYMVVATALLLGYITSNMFIVAINIYGWRVDKLSFALVMYNYAVVGTLAIFYQRGIPRWVTQGSLITSSVCLAWQFSYFSDWMAWTLLVMLALYDLFAVLSPCGPLKALAKLISKPGAPRLPGLLYEAYLPEGTERPKRKKRDDLAENADYIRNSAEEEKIDSHGDCLDGVYETSRNESAEKSGDGTSRVQPTTVQASDHLNLPDRSTWDRSQKHPKDSPQFPGNKIPTPSVTVRERERAGVRSEESDPVEGPENLDMSNTGSIPLALAKLYNLKIMDPKGALRHRRFSSTWKHYYSSEEVREGSWTPEQLRSEVTAIFPPRGGIISTAEEQKYNGGVTYVVYNRLGRELRKLVVTRKGKVMQVLRRDPESSESDNEIGAADNPSTIKLGLGDFVFTVSLLPKRPNTLSRPLLLVSLWCYLDLRGR